MDENTFIWKIVNLWWILISFIFLLNGFGLIFAGFKADEKAWKIEGIVYELIVLVFIIAVGIQPDSGLSSVITGIYLLSWIISIVRSFMISKKYLEKIRHDKYRNSKYTYINYDNDSLPDNGADTAEDTFVGSEYNKGMPETSSDDLSAKEIKPVYINTASAQLIAQLPGLDMDMAEIIVNHRQSGRAIRSFDELKTLLDLDDYQIEQLKDYVIIVPVNNKGARKLDI